MHRMRQRVVCALAALCFAWLASVAATHLHIGLDAGPNAAPAIKLALEINYWEAITPSQYSRLIAVAVVLPPSCGPPYSS